MDFSEITTIAIEAFREEYDNRAKAQKAFCEGIISRWKRLLQDRGAIVATMENEGYVVEWNG